jgi:hypothetical protein
MDIFSLTTKEVGEFVESQCADKQTKELMSWLDALKADKKVELDLTVAKLNVGKEISSGEFTRLREGREGFVKDNKFVEITTVKKVIDGDGNIVDKPVKTYVLKNLPSEEFFLPDVSEAVALRYCQLEDEDAMALAEAEAKAEKSDKKADLQALEALKSELADKYQVAKNLFITRTAMRESADSKRLLKLLRCEAARNFKRWKISSIQAVIQARTTEKVVEEQDAISTRWMTEDAKKELGL